MFQREGEKIEREKRFPHISFEISNKRNVIINTCRLKKLPWPTHPSRYPTEPVYYQENLFSGFINNITFLQENFMSLLTFFYTPKIL